MFGLVNNIKTQIPPQAALGLTCTLFVADIVGTVLIFALDFTEHTNPVFIVLTIVTIISFILTTFAVNVVKCPCSKRIGYMHRRLIHLWGQEIQREKNTVDYDSDYEDDYDDVTLKINENDLIKPPGYTPINLIGDEADAEVSKNTMINNTLIANTPTSAEPAVNTNRRREESNDVYGSGDEKENTESNTKNPTSSYPQLLLSPEQSTDTKTREKIVDSQKIVLLGKKHQHRVYNSTGSLVSSNVNDKMNSKDNINDNDKNDKNDKNDNQNEQEAELEETKHNLRKKTIVISIFGLLVVVSSAVVSGLCVKLNLEHKKSDNNGIEKCNATTENTAVVLLCVQGVMWLFCPILYSCVGIGYYCKHPQRSWIALFNPPNKT